jgi:type II secretory pathway component PulF
MPSCLINDKTSLKQQLIFSYSVITLLSAGITLGICLGLLFSLKDKATSNATTNLLSQTNSNAQALATEIANTINQQLVTIGESVCMVSANYASILMNYADYGSRGSTILKTVYVDTTI